MALQIAQDEHADEVLSSNPFALLAGMLLDQQFPMERAFAGPAKVLDRFGTLDPEAVASADPEAFAALCVFIIVAALLFPPELRKPELAAQPAE